VRVLRSLNADLDAIDVRIEELYAEADPCGVVSSAPGLGPVSAAAILGGIGDFARFENLAGVRSFTGFVPKVDESGLVGGHEGITKSWDAGLREALFLAADKTRRIDPTLAARYHRLVLAEGKHHNSALCSVAAVLITRIAACWRNGQRYELRDEQGKSITEGEGRAICEERYKIDPVVRAARRRTTPAKTFKKRAGPGKKESATKVAPAIDLPGKNATEKVA